MATQCSYNATRNPSSSQRGVAMVLALVSAIVLSPLYSSRRDDHHLSWFYHYETSWSSGLVLPMILAGLIIAIKSTSSSSSKHESGMYSLVPSDPSWMLRIGSSSWGLAGILVMLVLVVTWR
ncbi:hypothetical protein LINGRAHAP2_LOCUS12192 [Linum grandiflorum]